MMKNHSQKHIKIPSLRNIQSFIEVANFHSINVAAEYLNISASAVSHQIATLEKFIGKKLLIRNGKGVSLTQAGEKYLKDVSGAMSVIGRATDQLMNDRDQEILRVHSSPSFGLIWLMSRLGSFRTLHPELTINLTCSYENLQFARDNIDIDIRHGIPDWGAYRVMTIKNEKLTVFASPDYVEKNQLSQIYDIVNSALIHSTSTLFNWDKWFEYHNVTNSGSNSILIFDRSYMSFEAAKMGLGVILESDLLCEKYLENSELISVFGHDYAIPVSAHHLVMPHSHERSDKVQKFITWMSAELKKSGYSL